MIYRAVILSWLLSVIHVTLIMYVDMCAVVGLATCYVADECVNTVCTYDIIVCVDVYIACCCFDCYASGVIHVSCAVLR